MLIVYFQQSLYCSFSWLHFFLYISLSTINVSIQSDFSLCVAGVNLICPAPSESVEEA